MATIEIQGNNWSAVVLVSDSPQPNDIYHVMVKTLGETKEAALIGTQFVRDVFAKGRTAFMRVNPEADSDTDFDTRITRHTGFARFSFKIEAGEWQVVTDPPVIIGFGNLQCKEAV